MLETFGAACVSVQGELQLVGSRSALSCIRSCNRAGLKLVAGLPLDLLAAPSGQQKALRRCQTSEFFRTVRSFGLRRSD